MCKADIVAPVSINVDNNGRYYKRVYNNGTVKGIYNCPIEFIKGLTDKGQFQYLTKLKGLKW